jgi:predicted ATP-binding protein involved in virulence
LEFDKKPNSAFFIDKWLETSLLKESYVIREGLSQHGKNFKHILTKLEKAISEIIGYDVRIKMDEESLSEPVFYYDLTEHKLDVLPDGLKSILSWLLDLSMRLEKLTWVDDTPLFDRNIILFLDEVEAHLHIEWQSKILPAVQKLFPNAQIFVSTHSLFVVNSVDDAWIYNLEVNKGNAKVRKIELSQDGKSIASVLRNIFGVNETFGIAVENDLAVFRSLLKKAEAASITEKEEKYLYKLSEKLSEQGTELSSIVSFEMRQLEKLNKNYALK